MMQYGFCFRASATTGDNLGSLHMYVRDNRGTTRYIPTCYEIRQNEWDSDSSCLVVPADSTGRKRRLAKYGECMSADMRRMQKVVTWLEKTKKGITADDVINSYRSVVANNHILGVYAAAQAEELAHNKRERTARGYMSAVRRFINFNGGYDIEMDRMTPEMMNRFQQTLKDDGVCMSTISFYMRMLRAVYNKAVAEGLIAMPAKFPFEEVYTEIHVMAQPDAKVQFAIE
jgi:hypothetical protein